MLHVKIIVSLCLVMFQYNVLTAQSYKTIQHTIVDVQGNPFAKKTNGSFTYIKEGLQLQPGDIIHTDDNSSLVIIFQDKSLFHVKPFSVVKVGEIKYFPHANKDQIKYKSSFQIKFGRVQAKVTKHKNTLKSFVVSTPVGVASVRGTEKEVSYFTNKGMKVRVLSGVVLSRSLSGDSVYLRKDQKTTVNKTENKSYKETVREDLKLPNLQKEHTAIQNKSNNQKETEKDKVAPKLIKKVKEYYEIHEKKVQKPGHQKTFDDAPKEIAEKKRRLQEVKSRFQENNENVKLLGANLGVVVSDYNSMVEKLELVNERNRILSQANIDSINRRATDLDSEMQILFDDFKNSNGDLNTIQNRVNNDPIIIGKRMRELQIELELQDKTKTFSQEERISKDIELKELNTFYNNKILKAMYDVMDDLIKQEEPNFDPEHGEIVRWQKVKALKPRINILSSQMEFIERELTIELDKLENTKKVSSLNHADLQSNVDDLKAQKDHLANNIDTLNKDIDNLTQEEKELLDFLSQRTKELEDLLKNETIIQIKKKRQKIIYSLEKEMYNF